MNIIFYKYFKKDLKFHTFGGTSIIN